MGSGLGIRQRALRDALAAPDVEAIWVVPPDVNRSAATVWRRAAKGLVERGVARATYRRKTDVLGRGTAHLVLLPLDGAVSGDVLPLRSPGWIESPPVELLSFSAVLQSLLIEQVSGRTVSARTAASWAQEARQDLPEMPVTEIV